MTTSNEINWPESTQFPTSRILINNYGDFQERFASEARQRITADLPLGATQKGYENPRVFLISLDKPCSNKRN